MSSLPETASATTLNAYLKLAKKFSSHRMVGPSLREEKLFRLLSHCFTPEEAELAQILPYFYRPASLQKIARMSGRESTEIAPLLDSMTRKGLIRGKRKGYALLPLLPGMFENVLLMGEDTPWHRQFVQFADELFETGYIRRHVEKPVPFARTIPVGKTIYYRNITIDGDHMTEIIEAHSLMGVLHNCQCRQARHLAGRECAKADRHDGCLVFGRVAGIFIDRGSARQVSRKEMADTVKDRREKKLTFFGGNVAPASPNLICTCCDCCCSMLNQIIRPAPHAIVSPPPFLAVADGGRCVACGRCSSVCNVSAHSMVEGAHSFNSGRCVGCGACVDPCPAGALEMIPNSQYKKPASGLVQLGLKIIPGRLLAIAKSKLGLGF